MECSIDGCSQYGPYIIVVFIDTFIVERHYCIECIDIALERLYESLTDEKKLFELRDRLREYS